MQYKRVHFYKGPETPVTMPIAYTKSVSDTVTVTDTVSIIKVFVKILNDAIGVTDSIRRSITRSLSDSFTLTDSITKKTGKLLSDSISVSDRITNFVSARTKKFVGILKENLRVAVQKSKDLFVTRS